MADSCVRLSEVLVALSLATDLGFGQPAEHMLRSARISMRIGDRLGLAQGELATLFDVSLLTYVGCPIYGNEAAILFGDDIDFRAHAIEVDLAGFSAMRFMLGRAGSGTSALNRGRQAAGIVATRGKAVAQQMANHCAAAGQLAERLQLAPAVRAGIEQAYARWDGRGVPPELSGDRLSLAARIGHVAEACEVIERTHGVDDAVHMVRSRSGSHFDPAIASTVTDDPGPLFQGLDDDTFDEILNAEPIERPPLSEEQLDRALEAVGDFCDMRCPYFAGHGGGTAELVAEAAALLRLSSAEATLARRAALVHDLGRFGVPASVWDRPGPLNQRDRERMRMHVYYVERIFTRPEPLRRIGLLAAAHHERMDGSGYHRGVDGTMLSVAARLLAAADSYHAMTQPRPHRSALSAEEAAGQLRRDVREGRLDAVAVDAVLEVAAMAGASHERAGRRA